MRHGTNDPMWGTDGSRLNPGTPLGWQTSEIPEPEPENPEKPKNPFAAHLLYHGRTRAPTDMIGVPTDRA